MRLRMTAQSPRLSVTAQMSLTSPGAEFGDLRAGRREEVFRGLAALARQHHQELAAAARSQQDARQAQLGQQGARQHFAEQSDPLRASGEQIFAGGTHRTSFGGAGQKELFRAQDFTLQQDLFGHRTQKSLEKPSL